MRPSVSKTRMLIIFNIQKLKNNRHQLSLVIFFHKRGQERGLWVPAWDSNPGCHFDFRNLQLLHDTFHKQEAQQNSTSQLRLIMAKDTVHFFQTIQDIFSVVPMVRFLFFNDSSGSIAPKENEHH
uniref:Uncharacterized protein n=1 Tax=Arundo donax TaxID=35708 RepID=A0A0A8XT69_ARUDO